MTAVRGRGSNAGDFPCPTDLCREYCTLPFSTLSRTLPCRVERIACLMCDTTRACALKRVISAVQSSCVGTGRHRGVHFYRGDRLDRCHSFCFGLSDTGAAGKQPASTKNLISGLFSARIENRMSQRGHWAVRPRNRFRHSMLLQDIY